jgi:archaemetzincin
MSENLIVHPFGEVENQLVEKVSYVVKQQFRLRVSLGRQLDVPARSFSCERGQYLSTEFLNVLSAHEQDDEHFKLGITTVDLFVPELNFVFGEASTTLRAAVFSTARLDPRAYGEIENRAILIRRGGQSLDDL